MKKVYSHKGYKVTASSKEDAIAKIKKAINCKITAMSFDKDKLEAKIDNQTPNIIAWWCFCWYLKNINDVNGLLNHEKGKLKGLLRKLSETTFKGKNSKRVKEKIMIELWINGYEYDKKPSVVIADFQGKFSEENINYDEKLFQSIAKEFGNNVNNLIKLVCDTNYTAISDYVDSLF